MAVRSATTTHSTARYHDGVWVLEEDEIAVEYPLTIFVNDEEFATVVCTPDDLEEMVIGFLASEGVISSYQDVKQLLIDTNKGFAYADLQYELKLEQSFYAKRRITSCCGKSRQSFYFFSDARTAKPVESKALVTVDACQRLMDELQQGSLIHQSTGGVHNAALCTTQGIVVRYSDIGRHNALDKIYGYCLQNQVEMTDKLLVFSGRISSEVLLKAAKIGAGILISKSAPTDLALTLAEELGITAIGFVRNGKMNVYTGTERVVTATDK
ncbi:formate dehydrogenase accessory sulfurtransferase FdhD [Brevibacillus humidisoli]|uniref:formate dehydrogenase accessory sulfurtransferase FdhD n=1 Tax=Brevibacillus humidisoli TaxID=2895522 RepID=UPI001E6411BF|nr:formate dehydrogenase accessory sulfurtransferase FdhD [Brevibacillus humidisoli]UFJ42104.1 formate dehydrogenase accessory sulfurtransferase FdhD [Brevibacillus humidisoli]